MSSHPAELGIKGKSTDLQ